MAAPEVTAPTAVVELQIEGMTCASCATRIERRLNRLSGVTATVNYALASARVEYPATVSVDDLVGTVSAAGYGASLAPPPAPADRNGIRLLVAALLTMPLVVLSMLPALHFAGWRWLVLALATPVVLWCGWPFHRAALANARHAAATMDTLISLGALVSYAWSLIAIFTGGELYFEVGATVTTLLLAGRYVEARAKHRAGSALRALLELGAKDVALLRDGQERRVPVGELRVGDEFVVRPGEKVATDGVVVDGSSAIDASLLTGESVPVEVGPGALVSGATVNAGGRLVVRATRVGADTQLAQLGRLVREAQSGQAPVQRLADRVAGVFVPVVLVLAVLTLAGWLVAGADPGRAMTAAVAVLIVACPCALGLATPTALLVGTGRAAQLGIVVRGPEVLSATKRVDTVVLDKTGTVTTGRMTVLHTSSAVPDDSDWLRLAGAVEHAAEHPIARAIVAAALAALPDTDAAAGLPAVQDFQALPGLGAEGVVDGHAVLVGRPALLAARGVALPTTGPVAPQANEPAISVDAADGRAATRVLVAVDGVVRGAVTVADPVKEGSAAAVALLRGLGLEPVLLTGDSRGVAEQVAAELGIARVVAEVLPAGKVAVVQGLQADGRTVAMVGDGVNDAAALAVADLGIALGTGADVAIEASDLTLVRGDLRVAASAIRLSRATLRTIKGNLFWAFAYNVAALPLAAAGLVTPMLAAAAMALSSVFVVSNSLRLFRFRA